ncbi:MAG: UDP-N-acetylmuramoyl-L-alanine--D-glutamate ligase [Oceanicoccus sp.]
MLAVAKNDKQVIVGLGLTGLSCARYLSRKQHFFSVVDSRVNPPGLDIFRKEFPAVAISLGEISDDDLQHASRLLVSPGIGLDQPAIAKAIESGIVVCGDIDLFCEEANAPIVAITGSNGKTTVTTLVGMMVERCGKSVAVGGNIGVPALDLLSEQEPDIYVLELSSFQLERANILGFEVATVLNISADHMDRYPDLLTYCEAKHRIFRGCKKIVVNRADPLTLPLLTEDADVVSFGLDRPELNGFGLIDVDGIEFLAYQLEPLIAVNELKIVGRHNIENALAAMALGFSMGLELSLMSEVLKEFSGLAHRCQLVGERQQVKYYNDSKGTNVGAAVAAVEGLSATARKVILIAGGDAKGADFSPLLPVLKQFVGAVVVIGEASDQFVKLCGDEIAVARANSMEQAVAEAAMLAQSGDAVLLSPACASFDMFDNYQHRGDVFCAAVSRLIARGDS